MYARVAPFRTTCISLHTRGRITLACWCLEILTFFSVRKAQALETDHFTSLLISLECLEARAMWTRSAVQRASTFQGAWRWTARATSMWRIETTTQFGRSRLPG